MVAVVHIVFSVRPVCMEPFERDKADQGLNFNLTAP